MRVGWLELTSFRSYRALRFEPDAAVNLLVGPNGAGKTNILEAIDYLGTVRSFRSAPDEALVAGGEDAAFVRAGVDHHAAGRLIEIEIPRRGPRRIRVNGKRPGRHLEMRSHLRSVAFLPDDLDLAKGGPAGRRELLDDLAAQLRPAAGADRQDFDRSLRQRNALLRREGHQADRATLDTWDIRLAQAGARVLLHRRRAIEELEPVLGEVYEDVAGRAEKLGWNYTSAWAPADGTVDQVEETLAGALAGARRADLDRRTTTTGPHRDDPRLILAGRDVRMQASQGEQRSVVLALRLAEFDLVQREFGEAPVLLLDDVFSELDPARAGAVMARLPEAQVFVTTARHEEVPVPGRRWSVGGGALT